MRQRRLSLSTLQSAKQLISNHAEHPLRKLSEMHPSRVQDRPPQRTCGSVKNSTPRLPVQLLLLPVSRCLCSFIRTHTQTRSPFGIIPMLRTWCRLEVPVFVWRDFECSVGGDWRCTCIDLLNGRTTPYFHPSFVAPEGFDASFLYPNVQKHIFSVRSGGVRSRTSFDAFPTHQTPGGDVVWFAGDILFGRSFYQETQKRQSSPPVSHLSQPEAGSLNNVLKPKQPA